MKAFLYLIIFGLLFIIMKAFYFDDMLEKRALDSKGAIEANQSNSELVEAQSGVVQPENNGTVQKENTMDKGMPINELGDSIAKKLGAIF
ncbi:MAG: hypothetical protein NTY39_08175 [Campylobacterales bacterium]|nr:hypothetical protein [Campylobacterales bacterium]